MQNNLQGQICPNGKVGALPTFQLPRVAGQELIFLALPW